MGLLIMMRWIMQLICPDRHNVTAAEERDAQEERLRQLERRAYLQAVQEAQSRRGRQEPQR